MDYETHEHEKNPLFCEMYWLLKVQEEDRCMIVNWSYPAARFEAIKEQIRMRYEVKKFKEKLSKENNDK